MDVGHFFASLTAFDVLLILLCVVGFIAGILQGAVRRLIGIAAILLSFIVAAQLRAPLGDFLAKNWTQWPAEYSDMIGFGLLFLAFSGLTTLLIQVFYRPAPIWASHPFVDELLGAVLGVIQVLIVAGIVVMIMDPYYQNASITPSPNELPYLRPFHDALDQSASAGLYRDVVIPAFMSVFGPAIPDDVKRVFPGSKSTP